MIPPLYNFSGNSSDLVAPPFPKYDKLYAKVDRSAGKTYFVQKKMDTFSDRLTLFGPRCENPKAHQPIMFWDTRVHKKWKYASENFTLRDQNSIIILAQFEANIWAKDKGCNYKKKWLTMSLNQKANAINVAMPLLVQAIWGNIWKRTVEKVKQMQPGRLFSDEHHSKIHMNKPG